MPKLSLRDMHNRKPWSEVDGMAMCGGLLLVATCRDFSEIDLFFYLITNRSFFMVMMKKGGKN